MYKDKATENSSNFKRMRLKRGYTQTILAADSGIPLRTIQSIDQNGINGTAAATAYKLAKLLHCLIEDLIDDTPE